MLNLNFKLLNRVRWDDAWNNLAEWDDTLGKCDTLPVSWEIHLEIVG